MTINLSVWFQPCRWFTLLAMCLLVPLGACDAKPSEEGIGTTITGLDHLPEHLSIQDFWVNGKGGHQAGRGGSEVCCVALPRVWHPGLTVKVRWGVTNWKRRAFTFYERVVPVERYDEVGQLFVHFLPDGSVRAVSSMYAAWGQGGFYPGPSYDTVLKKQPWTDYKRKPEEPEFEEVKDAMKDGSS